MKEHTHTNTQYIEHMHAHKQEQQNSYVYIDTILSVLWRSAQQINSYK